MFLWMREKKEFDLLPHQGEFFFSEAPSTGLIAGYGSGKSYIAAFKCIARMTQYKCNVGYYLPTYRLLKDVAFENFENLFAFCNIPYKLNQEDMVYHTPWGKVFLRSVEKISSIIGYQTGYALIDEADVPPMEKMQKAYRAVIARNRIPVPSGVNATDMVSTPEGYKFIYDYYVKNKSDRRKLIHAHTLDNPYLSQSYIDNLYDSYPSDMVDAYMAGQFVNLSSGKVYRSFDRKINCETSKKIEPRHHLFIGMDFNITQMSATISIKEDGTRYTLDEITGGYDTPDMISKINERYPDHAKTIYPDAAGSARNTSGKSDHDMLKKAGFKVIAPKSNPAVRDRINKVNNEFDKIKSFVNPETCPHLVDALEQQGYNKAGEPDKQTGMDHIVDAYGYEVYNSEGVGVKIRSSGVY